MTTIELPAVRGSDGRLSSPIHATAVLVDAVSDDWDSVRKFDIDIYSKPAIQLDPPPINKAWRIFVKQGSADDERIVVFAGDRLLWNELTNVDRDTLEPIPTPVAVAEWRAFLEQMDAAKGDKGDKGDRGEKGDPGTPGTPGVPGAPGAPGEKGDPGDVGPVGAQGIQGVKGDKGDPGDVGPVGAQGIQGVKGDTGAQGVKGDTGAQGIQGVKGDTGATGAQGIQGIQGVKGDTGATGPTGPAPTAAGVTLSVYGTVTASSTGSCVAYRYGNLAVVNMDVNTGANGVVASAGIIGGLPVPAVTRAVSVDIWNSGGYPVGIANCYVDTAGVLRFVLQVTSGTGTNSIPASTRLVANFTYQGT